MKEIKSLLLNYTLWLERRGAFCEDLQIDWEHQIETFLELEIEKFHQNNGSSCDSKETKHYQEDIFDRHMRESWILFEKKLEEEFGE